MSDLYTVQLGQGLGLVEETPVLLDLWHECMSGTDLYRTALESGRFPTMSARRLRDFCVVGFAPRYLVNDGQPAALLKRLHGTSTKREFDQLLFLYTCRAHAILADFVREVYWPTYGSGRPTIANTEAREFTSAAVRDGKTTTAWSDNMVRKVGSYLTGCLADFGLLEGGARQVRKILPFRIEPNVAAFLAYDLHFAGLGDNRLLNHEDWALFGMDVNDVLEELKRLALRGLLIVQSAAGAVRIGWTYKSMEGLVDALIAE